MTKAAFPSADGVWDHLHLMVTPGLIDCHTHLVYGGQRANEFAMRLAGASYEESGYGLALEHERKQLRVARRLGEAYGLTVRTTFLGAHALPPEYAGRSQDYIDLVCGEMLPALAAESLVDAVDVFCERIAFTLAESGQVFQAAQKLGIPVKLHAEQLSDMEGSALAAATVRCRATTSSTYRRPALPR
jgi:imidazolonepropionase